MSNLSDFNRYVTHNDSVKKYMLYKIFSNCFAILNFFLDKSTQKRKICQKSTAEK